MNSIDNRDNATYNDNSLAMNRITHHYNSDQTNTPQQTPKVGSNNNSNGMMVSQNTSIPPQIAMVQAKNRKVIGKSQFARGNPDDQFEGFDPSKINSQQ